jgi:hypothetical protein
MGLRDARHLALVRASQDLRWNSCVVWIWRHRDGIDSARAAGTSGAAASARASGAGKGQVTARRLPLLIPGRLADPRPASASPVRGLPPGRRMSRGASGQGQDHRLASVRLPMSELRAGDVLHITRACGVQFRVPIVFRLIKVRTDLHTYHGWVWLEGYELDARGEAVARRELFVIREGIRTMSPPARPDPPPVPATAAPRRTPTGPRRSSARTRTAGRPHARP